MKYYLLSFLAATMAVCAQAQGTARLKGHISGATTECLVELMQATDNDYKIDTLKADANGNFDFVVEIMPNATECELLLSASYAKKNIFLSPDMVAELDIYIFPTGDRADPFDFKIDYSGDNADAYTYLNTYASLMDFYKRIANEMANWTFVEYREAVMKDMDNARHMLANIKNTEFRQKQYRLLYESLDQKLEIYPSKNADRHDPDAIKWIEGIEHNDTSNMMPAYDYFYWYLKEHNIKNDDLFKELPKIFYDQDMINKFADNQIVQMLRNAPENMDQLLADYLKVSTNEKGHVKAKEVYDHFNKMRRGMPSVDFSFMDEKGKIVHLSDFRGKALYIDLWATWCGGCVAETPYMAKLYDHYKHDKRIQLISISMDRSKSLWLKKNKEDKVTWPQFIEPNEFNSEMAKTFDITFIPRFLLFDKNGNILSLDAPRPSSEDIIEWIEKNIAE